MLAQNGAHTPATPANRRWLFPVKDHKRESRHRGQGRAWSLGRRTIVHYTPAGTIA